MANELPAYARQADEVERLAFGGITILVRTPSEATRGAFTLFEEVPPMADTPLHVHDNEDELFYVLEGEHVFTVGDEEYPASPGGLVFAPRGVPHAQRRVVPGEGRLLVVTAPGGLEGFFRELAAAEEAGTLGPDAYAAASQRYAITWVG
jgi:mannose-6-phosphate isomerase-like protein (cupin superfamily)